jgi:hypothetical protein
LFRGAAASDEQNNKQGDLADVSKHGR